MIAGVTFFTLLSGALSSMMTAYDVQAYELNEKLMYLNKIKLKNSISLDLYRHIRQALICDLKQSDKQLQAFIEDLPLNLRLRLS